MELESIEEILAQPLKPKRAAAVNSDKRKCLKCNGKGSIELYTHVKRGKCFKCNGKVYEYI